MELAPIIISCFSLLVAAFSLGWNIYRDVILKARIKVKFGFQQVFGRGMLQEIKFWGLDVINHGPGKIKLEMIHWKNVPLWRKILRRCEEGIIVYENNTGFYFSKDLPCELQVGDKALFAFPEDVIFLRDKKMTHIGLRDSFGREHWAPKKNLKKCL